MVSLPYYMLEELGVEPGDYFLIRRLADGSLKFTPVKAETVRQDRYGSKGNWRAKRPDLIGEKAGEKEDLSS